MQTTFYFTQCFLFTLLYSCGLSAAFIKRIWYGMVWYGMVYFTTTNGDGARREDVNTIGLESEQQHDKMPECISS